MSIQENDHALRICHFLLRTRVEGPGLRSGVWVQGCPTRCPGCGAPQTWAFDAGFYVDVNALAKKILDVPGISGITIAGGEPFEQAGALAALARKMQGRGLSVITFTGYVYESLTKRDNATDELLAATDLLIDGPYIESLASTDRPLVGSSNQRFIFLTNRLKSEWETWVTEPRRAELHILSDGRIVANGSMAVKTVRHMLRS